MISLKPPPSYCSDQKVKKKKVDSSFQEEEEVGGALLIFTYNVFHFYLGFYSHLKLTESKITWSLFHDGDPLPSSVQIGWLMFVCCSCMLSFIIKWFFNVKRARHYRDKINPSSASFGFYDSLDQPQSSCSRLFVPYLALCHDSHSFRHDLHSSHGSHRVTPSFLVNARVLSRAWRRRKKRAK